MSSPASGSPEKGSSLRPSTSVGKRCGRAHGAAVWGTKLDAQHRERFLAVLEEALGQVDAPKIQYMEHVLAVALDTRARVLVLALFLVFLVTRIFEYDIVYNRAQERSVRFQFIWKLRFRMQIGFQGRLRHFPDFAIICKLILDSGESFQRQQHVMTKLHFHFASGNTQVLKFAANEMDARLILFE